MTRSVIIIGSGSAGLTAALYSARANLKPLVIEGLEAGGQLMLTTLVENWPGHRDGIMGPDLMAEMRAQAERFGAEFIQGNVESVGLSAPPFTVKTTDATYQCRALIVATGATARLLGLPSERALLGHGVRLAPPATASSSVASRSRSSAGETRRWKKRSSSPVRVACHRRSPARYLARVENHAGQGVRQPEISFQWNSEVEDVRDAGLGSVTALLLHNRVTGERKAIDVDGVFVAIGHTPNTSLFTGKLEMDANGYIHTHSGTRTNIPGVFVCGDVQDHVYRQAITQAGSGCMADRRREVPGRAATAPR